MADGLCTVCKAARQCQHDRGPWITTNSRTRFYPLDPQLEDIHIEDIASALSKTSRFGGHYDADFYSVGQHSVLVASVVNEEYMREYEAGRVSRELMRQASLKALLHDASEAYYADLPRPLKQENAYLAGYRQLESVCQDLIYTRFQCAGNLDLQRIRVADVEGGNPFCYSMIKAADVEVLNAEACQIFTPALPWAGAYRAWIKIEPWPPEMAKDIFLQRFEMYGGKR